MTLRLAKLIFSIVVWIYDQIRIVLYRLDGMIYPGTCVVIYYHIVTSEQRGRFGRQMEDLIRLTKSISTETKDRLENGFNYSVITFDDGFDCIIKNAVPELIKHNIPFTIFVPTGYIGRKPKWIKNELSRGNCHVVMSQVQLKELKNNALVSIGSHCVTHTNLLLLNEEEAKNEIVNSKRDLENLLGVNVMTLSFPNGCFNQSHIELAHEAGYKRLFSISPKLAFFDRDEYVIGRIEVDTTDWGLEFRLKLLGAYRWLPIASSLKVKTKLILDKYLRFNNNSIGKKGFKD